MSMVLKSHLVKDLPDCVDITTQNMKLRYFHTFVRYELGVVRNQMKNYGEYVISTFRTVFLRRPVTDTSGSHTKTTSGAALGLQDCVHEKSNEYAWRH
jgi:hypothetical protein